MMTATMNTSTAALIGSNSSSSMSDPKMDLLDEVLALIYDESTMDKVDNVDNVDNSRKVSNVSTACPESLCNVCGHELSSKCLLKVCSKESRETSSSSQMLCDEVLCSRCKRELSTKCLMKMCQPFTLYQQQTMP